MKTDGSSFKEEVLLEPSNLKLLTKCVSQGMLIKDICDNVLKISKSNFYYMCGKHDKFKKAYYAGLQPAIFDCIDALKRMCEGYYVTEEKTDKDGNTTTYKKYIPPSVPALMFFLKNRDSKNWRDRWDIQLDGNDKPIIIKNDIVE